MFRLIFLLIVLPLLAPAQQPEKPVRLNKTEQIMLAAYDDTTRALTILFAEKRNRVQKSRKNSAIIGGISAASFVAGGLMVQSDLNSSSTASYNPENYVGMIFLLGGTVGVVYAVASFGISSLELNPYTIKKFNKLLALYKENKSLPDYYRKRINRYLPGNKRG